jgi:hypothetical protein
MYLAVGGIPETCLFRFKPEENKGWAIVGLGIEVTEANTRFLAGADWDEILSKETPWHNSLNGHFVAIRWKQNRVECFTDELGQRTLFFGKCSEGICVSTRLDWVARTTAHSELDFLALGGKWLLFNQLTYDSCVVGIERVGPRGHAVFRKRKVPPELQHAVDDGIRSR